MRAKILEVRDRGTFIPVLCIDMNDNVSFARRYHLRRCGYANDGKPNIIMTRLDADNARACNDPCCWSDRTFHYAHRYILENWAKLDDGDVVDVEFILGEADKPKISERFTEAS